MIHDITPSRTNPRNSEGDTLLMRDGRLLLVWTRFIGREDYDQADICLQETNDWGHTWSPSRVLVSHEEAQQNVMSVSLLHDSLSGDALLFYARKNGIDDLQIHVRRSSDDGHTWGPPTRVCAGTGYNVLNNARVIQTPGGRLLAPVAHCTAWADGRRVVAVCYISDDGGHSWRQSRTSVALPGGAAAEEPGLVRLSQPRSLLMCIRTHLGYVYTSRSDDEGETWSAAEPVHALPSPAAPSTLFRCPTGRLVALYNHREDALSADWGDRTPLAMAFSDDDGRTWARQPDIESDDAFCYAYTSARRYGNKMVLTYYVWPREQQHNFDQTTLRFRTMPAEVFCDV